MRSPHVLLLVSMSMGCACGATSPEPATRPEATTPAAVDYEVHEWGLVRAEPGDVLRFGAIAPPPAPPLVVLKPVLYFHTASRTTLRSVDVVAPSGGSILETWPVVAMSDRATWTSVVLDPGEPCAVSPLPAPTDPVCTALGGDLCEVSALAVARTTDAACVTTGGTTDRFLFYRGRSTTLTPPLLFERIGTSGEVRITHEGTAAIPGALVRIVTSSGAVRASVLVAPSPHESIVVPPATGEPAAGHTALHDSMIEIGLSIEEADAFLRAWDDTLFPGAGVSAAPPALDLAAAAPVDSFVYFLPASSTDDVATLVFDPPPRVVRRAIAVWSMLAASGPSH